MKHHKSWWKAIRDGLILSVPLLLPIAGAGCTTDTGIAMPTPCVSAEACADQNDCTLDTCEGGQCKHSPVTDESPCEAGQCMAGQCVPRDPDKIRSAAPPPVTPMSVDGGMLPERDPLLFSQCNEPKVREDLGVLSGPIYTVLVHCVTATDKAGRIAADKARCLRDIDVLNRVFASGRIRFEFSTYLELPSDDTLYTLPYDNNTLWSRMCVGDLAYLQKDGLPLVYVNEILPRTYSGYGGWCGAVIAARTAADGAMTTWAGAIGHEVGHALGLLHTYDCREDRSDPTNGYKVGDTCPDTNFDPGPAGVQLTCNTGEREQTFIGACTQANDCTLTCPPQYMPPPHGNLIMSAYRMTCLDSFTPGQYVAMRCALAQVKSNVIRDGCSPACGPGTHCVNGRCECNQGLTSCGGACIDLTVSDMNCGACGRACARDQACIGGACICTAPGMLNCGGTCVDPQIDARNCGGCARACSTDNVSATCSAGACVGTCQAGFADCDKNLRANGCEINVRADADNCGACGRACSGNNVARRCTASRCDGACFAGWDDCNGDKEKDGCEINTDADMANCGACGRRCSGNNVLLATCGGGVCDGACVAGFGDCDINKQANGCETNLQTSAANCGGCGLACSGNNAVPMCAGGQCVSTCTGGFGDCNNDRRGDGCETNLFASASNCGGCGAACSVNHVAPTCTGGTCTGACFSGWADCNGDRRRDGCETNILSDPNNCSGCSMQCSRNNITPLCLGGTCAGTCTPGWDDCNRNKALDGCETSLIQDPNNCGGCGASCSWNHIARACSGGLCTGACEYGWLDCDGNKRWNGCEVNSLGDVNNCGGCNVVCSSRNISRSCGGGRCNGACFNGYADCNNNKQTDGCETWTNGDVGNCGACGRICSSNHVNPQCSQGTCTGTCAAGWGDCDGNRQSNGCETSLNTVSNCGACGRSCGLGETCVNGACEGYISLPGSALVFPLNLVHGDAEFGGKGEPHVYTTANASAVNNGTQIQLRLWVRMVEQRADWSEGTLTRDIYVNVPNGRRVASILSTQYWGNYVDTSTQSLDFISRVGAYSQSDLVSDVGCVGDTPHEDVCNNVQWSSYQCSGCMFYLNRVRVRYAP